MIANKIYRNNNTVKENDRDHSDTGEGSGDASFTQSKNKAGVVSRHGICGNIGTAIGWQRNGILGTDISKDALLMAAHSIYF